MNLFYRLNIAALIFLGGFQSWAGSSYEEVRSLIKTTTISSGDDTVVLSEKAKYLGGELPQYEVSLRSIFNSGSSDLEKDAVRTVTDQSDFYPRLQKLIHSNGICVFGEWSMNPESKYTGAFREKDHLFIGRISVAMQETKVGFKRSFGFAGKIFPTSNPTEVVDTENFFSVDVLMGTKVSHFLDTRTTNEPELGFDLWVIKLGLKIASALSKADENPRFRPVRNLGSQGLSPDEKAVFPKWIRVSADSKIVKNNEADFRHEVLKALTENKELVFNVDGSDITKDRSSESGWAPLGQIRITEAAVSYGCDRQLHFAHPKLK